MIATGLHWDVVRTAAPPDLTVEHSSLGTHVTATDLAWASPAAEQPWRTSGNPCRPRLAAELQILADAVFATQHRN